MSSKCKAPWARYLQVDASSKLYNLFLNALLVDDPSFQLCPQKDCTEHLIRFCFIGMGTHCKRIKLGDVKAIHYINVIKANDLFGTSLECSLHQMPWTLHCESIVEGTPAVTVDRDDIVPMT